MTAAVATPNELEESLLDAKVIRSLQDDSGHIDPDKMAAHVVQYQTASAKKNPDIASEVADQLEKGFQDFFARHDAKPMPMGELVTDKQFARNGKFYKNLGMSVAQRRQIAATGRGPGVEFFEKYANFSDFLTDVPKITNALSEGTLADGGATVPEEYRAELLMLALEDAMVRSRATIIPMNSASVRIPAIRDASHATSVFGGVQGSWLNEAANLSSGGAGTTQPTFQQVMLTARKLTGFTIAANELLMDSALSLEALIMTLFAKALAYFEDDAFISGVGAGQPLGILNADAMVSVTKETGQPAATINYQNIVKAFSRMLPQSLNRAVWYCGPDAFPELAQMALNVGTGGAPVWISNIQNGAPASIFGRPLIITEKAQALGTAGDLVFADMSYYLIGDRQSLQMTASQHYAFATDQMAWRFVQRVDGRPWIQTALTPRHSTATLSPFVSLATRS